MYIMRITALVIFYKHYTFYIDYDNYFNYIFNKKNKHEGYMP